MKTIKRLLRQFKERNNTIPYKVVKLPTGLICEHYRNGDIKVKAE